MEQKHYVIQWRLFSSDQWTIHSPRFATVAEAKAHARQMGYLLGKNFRIAEAYVQVRYKAVKE